MNILHCNTCGHWARTTIDDRVEINMMAIEAGYSTGGRLAFIDSRMNCCKAPNYIWIETANEMPIARIMDRLKRLPK